MKLFSLLALTVILAFAIAANVTNKTQTVSSNTTNKTSVPVGADDDDDNFYTVDVLLTAEGVSTSKAGQNETGLSIRLTARDGTVSTWYRLTTGEDSNSYGQRNYYLSGNPRDLGFISSVALRVDKPELSASSSPYYLCLRNTFNSTWFGCTYIQSLSTTNANEKDQQYPLRDSNGQFI